MRILRFIVKGQSLQKDPNCDFSGIVRGSKGYLIAEFIPDASWRGCTIAASFWHFDKEYAVLVKNGRCEIPAGALEGFSVGVTLKGRKQGYELTTNKVTFNQEG